MLRLVSSVMLVYFLIVFLAQYNDPDPLLWMLIYGYACIVTSMAVQRWYTGWALVGALGYLAGFAALIPSYNVTLPWIEQEEVREALGLLVGGVWMLVLTGAWLRHRGEPEELAV